MSPGTPAESPLILIVDDSQDMRTQFQHFLTRDGYRIAEAESGAAALSSFSAQQPDLILLDLAMPKMDGITACTRLRQLPGGAQLPIIVVTAMDDTASIENAFAAGATDYITKPVHWAVLSHRVKTLLAASRAKQRLSALEARMTAIAANAKDAVITFSEEGRLETANPAMQCLTGYSAIELEGCRSEQFFAQLALPELADQNTQSETLIRCKDESQIPIELFVSRFTLDERIIYAAIIRDISLRKQIEAENTTKTAEIVRMNKLFIDRELRMQELKEQLAQCQRQLGTA